MSTRVCQLFLCGSYGFLIFTSLSEPYFFDLNVRFQRKQPVSAVDVDIFANIVNRLENLEELEFILKNVRQTTKTVDTLDSTHHAVCRFYLSVQKLEQLLSILNQRVPFGIFPDTYIYNILMDQCLNEKNLEYGFDVVKLMMLQEDSGNEISKTLALHILNQLYTQNAFKVEPEIENTEKVPEEEEDEDEIEYIRVPFLTNAFFDNHFEITNRNHIFGKSLYFFGYEVGKSTKHEDQILSYTSQLIGLIYYQNWTKLHKVLDRIIQNKTLKITNDVSSVVQNHLSSLKDETILNELKQVSSKISQIPTEDTTMTKLINDRCQLLPSYEAQDIESMLQMFEQFEKKRVDTLQSQMDELLCKQKEKELEDKQKDLEQKKRLYYFFENFPKHEIDFLEAEKRIDELKRTTVVDENYIPPEKY